MATMSPGYVFGVSETVTNTKLGLLVSSGTTTNIVNADIDAAAAIVDTKLATISTAGKVNTTALVTTSQAAGDVLYNNGSNWVRLAKDEDKYLKSGASAVSWATVTAVNTPASQAEMEAGTENGKMVTPLVAQYHQSAAKAWCKFDPSTSGTNAPTVGYQVTSVSKGGTGYWTVNLSVAMSSANYAIIATGHDNNNGICSISVKSGTAISASAFTLQAMQGTPTLFDPTAIFVVVYGDI